MEDIYQEIEVIQSIFCGKDEVSVVRQSTESVALSVNLHIPQLQDGLTLTLVLHKDYPTQIPQISLKSFSLTRDQCNSIKLMLEEQCNTMKGEQMLFQSISNLQSYMEGYISNNQKNGVISLKEEIVYTSLLRIDHMRNRHGYSKTICRWSDELGLTGRLIFCKKFIFVLLQGSKENIKKYVRLNRTQSVDVDSKGRNCKERLLTVLKEETSCYGRKYSDFKICEDIPSMEDLKANLIRDGFDPLAYELESLA